MVNFNRYVLICPTKMMVNFMKINYFKAACLFICASVSGAIHAQTQSSTNPIAPITNEWKFSLTPYAWLPGISTEAPFTDRNSSSDVTAGDVLKHLSGAAMLSGQARYGKWGLLADVAHAELTDEHVQGNMVSRSSTATIKLTTFTGAISYNVLHEPQLSIDTLVGVRTVNVKANWHIDFEATDQDRISLSPKARATDPVIGIKGRSRIQSTDWYIPFYFDMGGQSGKTDMTWQALIGIGKAYPWGDVMLGYRALYYDMKAGEPLQKTKLGGFSLGVGFNF
jgi:hypothetical protein